MLDLKTHEAIRHLLGRIPERDRCDLLMAIAREIIQLTAPPGNPPHNFMSIGDEDEILIYATGNRAAELAEVSATFQKMIQSKKATCKIIKFDPIYKDQNP